MHQKKLKIQPIFCQKEVFSQLFKAEIFIIFQPDHQEFINIISKLETFDIAVLRSIFIIIITVVIIIKPGYTFFLILISTGGINKQNWKYEK